MTRKRFATLVASLALSAGAALAFGSAGLGAQQPPAKAKKEPTPQSDSIKALKRNLKYGKADARAAKEKGDTAKARQIKQTMKAEKKTLAKMQGKDTTKKDSTKKKAKKPLP